MCVYVFIISVVA